MIPGIDGLRAIAVLALLAFHVNGYDLGFGWQGVQFFFVLSGFLITSILLRMKEAQPARQYFNKFYGRRFLRIFPLYYFYLFVLTILLWQSNLIPFESLKNELQNFIRPQLPYAYFYVYDFFFASSAYHVAIFLTHFWSLAVEEQFYIVWPLLLFFTPKEKIKNLFLLTIVLGPVFRLIAYFVYSNHLFPFLADNTYLSIYALPFSHVDAFAMGAYISQLQLPNPRKQLAILLWVVPLLGYITQYLSTGIIDLGTLGYEFKMFTAYKFVWGYSILNYLFALVIQNVHQSKLFIRVFDHFTLRYLGKISYGIYVYHVAVLWFIVPLLKMDNFQPLWRSIITYLVALGLTTVIASASFYLLEKPISDLKDKLFPLHTK
jgi:peptidoglycan/LPS O-acetylase OafA/YrhL